VPAPRGSADFPDGKPVWRQVHGEGAKAQFARAEKAEIPQEKAACRPGGDDGAGTQKGLTVAPSAHGRPAPKEHRSTMAKPGFPRFFSPGGEARAAEAAKTTRLRALRLAKEADDAEKAAAAPTAARSPRRVRASPPQAGGSGAGDG
jgi:hypothetical protein